MNQKINQKEFDKRLTKVMKYGISLGLIIGFIIALLEYLTGAKGKIAEYSIVVLSVAGFIIFIAFIIYVSIQLHKKI
jgi:membrane protein YdbS with pleckstrin-like domain